MKKIIFTLLMLFNISIVLAQIPGNFNKTGTMYRTDDVKGFTYVLLDSIDLPPNAIANKVTLKRSLYTHPQTDLFIEVYNVVFDKKQLAVFSVMPSLFSKTPTWKKINLDTIKDHLIKISQLRDTMLSKFAAYPVKRNGLLDKLKSPLYILVVKKNDGYYCSTTDCFSEFFDISIENRQEQQTGFHLDLNAKPLSIMEYEAGYKRIHGNFSSNFQNPDNSYFNTDVANGPKIYLSYIVTNKGTNDYKFWLLDNWVTDGRSPDRGMDRFVFQPGIGIKAAAYEFFMRDLTLYWYHLPKSADRIEKGTEQEKNFYLITPFFQKLPNPALFDYLTEDVINCISINKL